MKKSNEGRYKSASILIKAGDIKTFPQIFEQIPKTIVYRDMHMNFNRFSKAIYNPARFTLGHLREMARLFDLELSVMLEMAIFQMNLYERQRRRKNPLLSKKPGGESSDSKTNAV